MSENPFQFLTKEDLNLLAEKADRVNCVKNELILEEGSRRQAIFIIRQGTVRVERTHSGRGVAYVRLGPGEIFGEMSFVENEGASASVYADSEVEVDVVAGHNVNALMASVPGFGTRFYQSLAVTLAHRLRSTSMMIPALMVEEVPQPKRSPVAAKPEEDLSGEVPASLLSEVQSFRRDMLKADRSIKNREMTEQQAEEAIVMTCSRIHDALSRHVRQAPGHSKAIGATVFREVFPFFMLSKRFDRLYTKPRGYAADYDTIELLTSGEREGTGRLGKFIDAWLLNLPFCRAFKSRIAFQNAALDRLATDISGDSEVRVTLLGGSTSREVLTNCLESGFSQQHVTCLDTDSEALHRARQRAGELHASDRLTVLQENVMRLALGKGALRLEPQHIICCAGLLDHAEDSFSVRLLNWIFDRLVPGGIVVLTNFADVNPDKVFMDYILDWQLFHRSAVRLNELFRSSSFSGCAPEIKSDDTGTQLLVMCVKES
jgi:CRP-like cAMP-binding protein/SAM-dependent methyltransferase